MKRNILIAGCLLAGLASESEARFLENDADRLDPEERLSTEYYNDLVSYRAPAGWAALWEGHDVGVRLNAGSLNINRFAYAEDVKLATPRDGAVRFGFASARREDYLEQRTERELRVDGTILPGLRLVGLADGSALKEFGDLGLGVEASPIADLWIALSYWSVDHYYMSKKAEAVDERDGRAGSLVLAAKTSYFELRYERDQPFTWKLRSRGYDYTYSRSIAHAVVKTPWVDLATDLEWKAEAFAEAARTRSLVRTVAVHEATRRLSSVEVGAQWIERRAAYRQHALAASWREEAAIFATHAGVVQSGLFANAVHLREDGRDRRELHVKAQAAWEYAFTPKARAFLNSTWDLDELSRRFRPWGGGDLQFLAVF